MKNKEARYRIGIDIGSTTVKMAALRPDGTMGYSRYDRHNADISRTVCRLLSEMYDTEGNVSCRAAITGSGGMKLAELFGVPFIQEVVGVTAAVREELPATDVVIELGGEDAKIIYLTGGTEQRMNGICAGGTGAFIDQMASLLQTDAGGLNQLAEEYRELYPIAARCGVFAKSDIQPLINDGASKHDLAASIFQAIVNQTISGLACGRRIQGTVAFLGGPLHYLSELRAAFARTLHLSPEEAVCPEDAHLFAAKGAAMACEQSPLTDLKTLLELISRTKIMKSDQRVLEPLFKDEAEYERFQKRQSGNVLKSRPLENWHGRCYLGLDAGSTTTKAVLISEQDELLYSFYGSNHGDPLAAAKEILSDISRRIPADAVLAGACSTGYGESLIKDAFSMDTSEVETVAHFYAAKRFDPEVDGILDIGGQDMKYMQIQDGSIGNIVLNEACSSGCGSFIESFANSLGYTAEEFAAMALKAKRPVDLGTRCTVFMNSNVKQAQKEGAAVEDIAAGLAYSVIKNALFKVIKMRSPSELGSRIVVQGGTFCNDGVLRALELITGRQVVRPAIAGLMGAFGAALIAMERCGTQPASSMMALDAAAELSYRTGTSYCGGCVNHCRLHVHSFSNGNIHISGNRCEKGLRNNSGKKKAPDLVAYKRKRLFDYEPLPEEAAVRGIIGIPRTLNFYENYPFWAVFFREMGFRTVLSPESDQEIYTCGQYSIPSESECFPAKLAHGHVQWLIDQGITSIFYPCVYYEEQKDASAQNRYNCPMVISYPENIRNNVDALKERGVQFFDPFLSFADEKTLCAELQTFMEEHFAADRRECARAVRKGWEELSRFHDDMRREGERVLRWIEEHQCHGIVLAGRPYQADDFVNHGIAALISSYGYAVLTEDSVAHLAERTVSLRAYNQWVYHSRLYAAAEYVGGRSDLDLIQLNSFGCGLDAITIDQVHDILSAKGKLYTCIKIDEVSNLGAVRIRLRSLFAAVDTRRQKQGASDKRQTAAREAGQRVEYTRKMQEQGYTILCTTMSPFHFDLLAAAMESRGYRLVMLKNEGANVADLGLRYVNNDACYPALVITGQILDALGSGKYALDRIAVMTAQTGGSCRATNYVGLIRKALEHAGYGKIPVISANFSGMEKNSGFRLSVPLLMKGIQSLIYGDLLSLGVLRTRPYEKTEGAANRQFSYLTAICQKALRDHRLNWPRFYRNCRKIIEVFDRIPLRQEQKPKVGIVGEVLVKYMPLANNHLIEVLEKEGMEVVMPGMIEFLQYCFWNAQYRADHLGGKRMASFLSKAAISVMNRIRKRIFVLLDQSQRFHRPASIGRIRQLSARILQSGVHSGEGWFLPGEVSVLIEKGVSNIVCVQPFGCLPNHIVGKGIIKRVRELYPEANITAVDYDPGASEVNQLNRIKLMIQSASK